MSPAEVRGEVAVRTLSCADWLVTQEPAMIEPEAISEDVPVSPSWTPSYSTTVHGSSPRIEFETVLKDDLKPALHEPSTSDDVPTATQDAEPVPAPAELVVVEEVSEPVADTSLDETPAAEGEATETPKIVTPAGEPIEPAATTETPWAQSYSVTSQPGSPHVSPKAEPRELEPEPQPTKSIQETPMAPPIVELSDLPRTVITSAVEDEDDHVTEPVPEEELKSTWTQSYSVTSQPGSPRVSPKQVSEEIPGMEEEKPLWTRSYSVTSQPGSPRVLPKEDMLEPTLEPLAIADEPTTVVALPVEEPAPAPAKAEATERPKSPWTPSYSVTTLEGQTEQPPPEGVVPEPEVDVPVSEPLAIKDEQLERPKSPWTPPSYSVTTLPGSAPVEESESHPIVDTPSVDLETPAPEPVESMKTAEEHPKENGVTSDVFEVYEAIAQPHQADLRIPEPAPPQLDLVSLTRHSQMICSILTGTFSPSWMLPTRLGRDPPGLLPIRSRTFQVQVRTWRRRMSLWLLEIFQQLMNSPRGRPNPLPPTMHAHKVLLMSPRRRQPRMVDRITSPGCLSHWMRLQRGKLISFHVYCLVVVLTKNT